MLQTQSVLFLFSFSALCHGFNPAMKVDRRYQTNLYSATSEKAIETPGKTDDDAISLFDERSGKPTGISYLPSSTIQRARENGSPIEKIKLEKDGTSAFVDVYEYARKIRAGEMTWEEVDKADLDSVRTLFAVISFCLKEI